MTRAEHIQWCKDRALAYVDAGQVAQAWASLVSDLGKHAETKGHLAIGLAGRLWFTLDLNSPAAMRRFIEGVN